MASRRPSAKNGSLAFPPCTDSALQIQKRHIHRSFPHPYQQVFFISTQPGAVSLTPYTTFYTALPRLTFSSGCTKTTERVLSCSKPFPCVRKLFLLFSFSCLYHQPSKEGEEVLVCGIFRINIRCTKETNLATGRVGGDKKRKGTFFFLSVLLFFCLSVGCTFITMSGSF
jgi:hypothetical protein